MAPSQGRAITADSDFDSVHKHRAVISAAHVVFTSEDQLDWSTAYALGDGSRFSHQMRIDQSAPSKRATGEQDVELHLLGSESQHFRNCRLLPSGQLTRNPRFRAVAVKANREAKWFHWRVRQIWKFKLGNDPLGFRNSIDRHFITAFERNSTGRFRQLFILSKES